MTTFQKDYFRDERDGLFKTHPLQIIKGSSQSAAPVKRFADSHNRPGAKRVVFYNDPDGDYEVKLTLMMWEHTGADLTDLTDAIGASEAVRAGNPTGRLIGSDGTFKAVSAEKGYNLVGWAFNAYYLFQRNALVDDAAVDTIEDGDWFWVIRDGVFQVRAGEDVAGNNIAAGDLLVTDLDAAHSEGGRVRLANVMSTPNAAEIYENTQQKVVGMALETEDTENALFLAKVAIDGFGYEIYDVAYP